MSGPGGWLSDADAVRAQQLIDRMASALDEMRRAVVHLDRERFEEAKARRETAEAELGKLMPPSPEPLR